MATGRQQKWPVATHRPTTPFFSRNLARARSDSADYSAPPPPHTPRKLVSPTQRNGVIASACRYCASDTDTRACGTPRIPAGVVSSCRKANLRTSSGTALYAAPKADSGGASGPANTWRLGEV